MWAGRQVKSPRLLDSGSPEARSSLVKTKVKLVKVCFLKKLITGVGEEGQGSNMGVCKHLSSLPGQPS